LLPTKEVPLDTIVPVPIIAWNVITLSLALSF